VRPALIFVPRLPNAAGEMDARPLLDDMGRLVGGQVQVRGAREGDVLAGGVGPGADAPGRLRSRPADVGAHLRQIMRGAEGPLDLRQVRQAGAAASDPLRRRSMDLLAVVRWRCLSIYLAERMNGRWVPGGPG